MTTRIIVDRGVSASRYLDTYPYPSDITQIPALIPGLVLQADWDVNDPSSLTRNRVGGSMSVVGSPTLGDYGVTVNEANYINTNIDIASLNTGDATMISIMDFPGVVSAVVGRIQINAPQRTRGIQTNASSWFAKWLTVGGAGQQAVIANSAPAGNSELFTARFTRDNGAGSMVTQAYIPRTGQKITTTAATTAYSMPSSNILIGASTDAVTTGSSFIRAILAVNRVLTDTEIASIYATYRNYYALKGKTI